MKTIKSIIAISVLGIASVFCIAGDGSKAMNCSTGVCGSTTPSSEEGFKLLTSGEMKQIVTAKSAIILDARTGKYDDGQRIPGAKALSPSSSKEEAAMLIPDKSSAIITYCANLKCPASAALAKHLKELGYTNIREYPEGIQGWLSDGNPVEKAMPAAK